MEIEKRKKKKKKQTRVRTVTWLGCKAKLVAAHPALSFALLNMKFMNTFFFSGSIIIE